MINVVLDMPMHLIERAQVRYRKLNVMHVAS